MVNVRYAHGLSLSIVYRARPRLLQELHAPERTPLHGPCENQGNAGPCHSCQLSSSLAHPFPLAHGSGSHGSQQSQWAPSPKQRPLRSAASSSGPRTRRPPPRSTTFCVGPPSNEDNVSFFESAKSTRGWLAAAGWLGLAVPALPFVRLSMHCPLAPCPFCG